MRECSCGGQFDIYKTVQKGASRIRYFKCCLCSNTTDQKIPADIWDEFFTRHGKREAVISPST